MITWSGRVLTANYEAEVVLLDGSRLLVTSNGGEMTLSLIPASAVESAAVKLQDHEVKDLVSCLEKVAGNCWIWNQMLSCRRGDEE